MKRLFLKETGRDIRLGDSYLFSLPYKTEASIIPIDKDLKEVREELLEHLNDFLYRLFFNIVDYVVNADGENDPRLLEKCPILNDVLVFSDYSGDVEFKIKELFHEFLKQGRFEVYRTIIEGSGFIVFNPAYHDNRIVIHNGGGIYPRSISVAIFPSKEDWLLFKMQHDANDDCLTDETIEFLKNSFLSYLGEL